MIHERCRQLFSKHKPWSEFQTCVLASANVGRTIRSPSMLMITRCPGRLYSLMSFPRCTTASCSVRRRVWSRVAYRFKLGQGRLRLSRVCLCAVAATNIMRAKPSMTVAQGGGRLDKCDTETA